MLSGQNPASPNSDFSSDLQVTRKFQKPQVTAIFFEIIRKKCSDFTQVTDSAMELHWAFKINNLSSRTRARTFP